MILDTPARRTWSALVLAGGCVQYASTYALTTNARAHDLRGQVQVERVEGNRVLVVVELSRLAPPEQFASGLTEFVVWLEDPHGARVNAGTLRYDRARKSGSMLATTPWHAFTMRVTGERDPRVDKPSDVVLASRQLAID
jgi:hypothetical protein